MAEWFLSRARQHAGFSVELIDLKHVNLPLLDEPNHPRLQRYQHEHTKQWSMHVSRTEAFVFVTPEYNYGPSPALVNALDYLYVEWNYKACGFVSYGGMSGGIRGVQAIKPVVTTLKMVPLVEAVAAPFFARQIENGVFKADDGQEKAASALLDELHRWTDALKPLRG